MQISVTVAICTWNRAALLDQTLERMKCLEIPEGVTWELLVVNNNCTDNTDEIIQKHSQALPIKRLFEPKQGHSNARNCAIDHAQGELMLWTDDDVLVDSRWLVEYGVEAKKSPHVGYFGGTVDPWFEVSPPSWILHHLPRLEGPYALRRLGYEVRPLDTNEDVFGANMAFRTSLIKKFPFNPSLGRVGMGMMSGDETDVIARIKANGYNGLWVGTAKVRHYIPADRLSVKFLWMYYRGSGQTFCRMNTAPVTTPRLFGAPRWLIRRYAQLLCKHILLSPTRNAAWLNSLCNAAMTRGMIDEYQAASKLELSKTA